MIPLETVLDYATSYKGGIKNLAIERLKRENTRPFGSRWMDEDPVDMLEPLLIDPNSPKTVRDGVLDGWISVYKEVYEWINSKSKEDNNKPIEYISSICRVAELAKPKELEDKVKDLVQTAMNNGLDKSHPKIAYEILSARCSYHNITNEDMPLIEYLIKQKEFAGSAFEMLIQMKPRSEHAERYLYELWCRHYDDNLPLHMVFLTVCLEKRLDKNSVLRVMQRLQKERSDIWPKITEEIKSVENDLGKKLNYY